MSHPQENSPEDGATNPGSADDQVDELLAVYLKQCDTGSMPDRKSFLNQHPELREHLEDLLSTADWIEQLAGPTIADISSREVSVPGSDKTQLDDTIPLGQSPELATPESEQADWPDKKKVDSWREQEDRDALRSIESTQPILPCRFGDYVLERIIGRGGMGVVYQGHQSSLERQVAIKMIRSGALASDEEVERFYAEAKSAAKLDHPNIVTVYQCGEQDGHRYFSMDYVPGTDLSRMTHDGPIEPKRAARYVRDVARAIQYAHDKGILHRDLKPANILVDEEETVRITDFGLAKSIGTETGLTAEGAALGTPSYMSPEQAAGKVDEQHHATDVYSLGAILFTIVTGKPPFKANTVVETIMHVIHPSRSQSQAVSAGTECRPGNDHRRLLAKVS